MASSLFLLVLAYIADLAYILVLAYIADLAYILVLAYIDDLAYILVLYSGPITLVLQVSLVFISCLKI